MNSGWCLSKFCPPDFTQVGDYIEELLTFVNSDVSTREQLLRVAVAHHRFACIHPFDNGNGRVVRLFTYALLLRYGFQLSNADIEDEWGSSEIGRILNPTAIFCEDREKYYDMLERADSGKKEDVLHWCEYVLEGLLREIKKIDNLSDYTYLKKHILLPAIGEAKERGRITDDEYDVLSLVFKNNLESLKAVDLRGVFKTDDPVKISRMIGRLKEKGILKPEKTGGRTYNASLTNKCLLPSVADALERHGFAQGLTK